MLRGSLAIVMLGCGGMVAPNATDAASQAPPVIDAALADVVDVPIPVEAGDQPTCNATLLASISSPVDVVLDDANAYVASALALITSVAKDGSASNALTTQQALFGFGGRIALDSSMVYWTADDALNRVPTTGGAKSSTVVFGGGKKTGPIAAGDGEVYFTLPGTIIRAGKIDDYFVPSPDVSGIAVDATNAYWTDRQTGNVSSASLATKATTTLATSPAPERIAIDATDVYWTDPVARTVSRVSKTGGAVSVVASSQNDPFAIALDSTDVYWTSRAGGMLLSAPITGGAPSVVCGGLIHPLALDGTYVYFVTSSALYRLPKP